MNQPQITTREQFDALLTTAEVARHLKMSKSWVEKAVSRGQIPAIHIGRSVRFDLAEIYAWVRNQKPPESNVVPMRPEADDVEKG